MSVTRICASGATDSARSGDQRKEAHRDPLEWVFERPILAEENLIKAILAQLDSLSLCALQDLLQGCAATLSGMAFSLPQRPGRAS
jgi:hypothetical protein